ncbi:hypothetical protein B7494_g6849 [Chlorociboria aeruginascens]|nr:hypothetical protein B7494_g6849 [Chlorociboria aeruginascens]
MKLIQSALALLLLGYNSTVQARNCHSGVNYCQSTLINIGNYQSQLDQVIFDYTGLYTEYDQAGKNYLFKCKGGRNGVIDVIQECPGACHDTGTSDSDYCVTSSMSEEGEDTETGLRPEIQVQVNVERIGL